MIIKNHCNKNKEMKDIEYNITKKILVITMILFLTLSFAFQNVVFAEEPNQEKKEVQTGEETQNQVNNQNQTNEPNQNQTPVENQDKTKKIEEKNLQAKKKNLDKQKKEAQDDFKREIPANGAVVFCKNTGENLYKYRYSLKTPVSKTEAKLLIAILTMQKFQLNQQVKIRPTMFKLEDVSNEIGLKNGDIVTVETLLYGAFLTNSESCLWSLVQNLSPSKEKFLELMNKTLEGMGCKDTKINSVLGDEASDDKSYSSVNDFLDIAKIAESDKTIKKILGAREYHQKKQGKLKVVTIKNKSADLIKDTVKGIAGGTSNVFNKQNTEVFFYNKNGLELIGVIFQADENKVNSIRNKLIKEAVEKVKGVKVIAAGEEMGNVHITHGAETKVPMYAVSTGLVYLPKEADKELVTVRVIAKQNLKAPIKSGEVVGTAEIMVADEKVNEVQLVIKEDVKKGWLPSYIGISNKVTSIILGILAFCLFIIFLRIINKAKARQRRKRKKQELIMRMAIQKVEEERQKQRSRYR